MSCRCDNEWPRQDYCVTFVSIICTWDFYWWTTVSQVFCHWVTNIVSFRQTDTLQKGIIKICLFVKSSIKSTQHSTARQEQFHEVDTSFAGLQHPFHCRGLIVIILPDPCFPFILSTCHWEGVFLPRPYFTGPLFASMWDIGTISHSQKHRRKCCTSPLGKRGKGVRCLHPLSHLCQLGSWDAKATEQ